MKPSIFQGHINRGGMCILAGPCMADGGDPDAPVDRQFDINAHFFDGLSLIFGRDGSDHLAVGNDLQSGQGDPGLMAVPPGFDFQCGPLFKIDLVARDLPVHPEVDHGPGGNEGIPGLCFLFPPLVAEIIPEVGVESDISYAGDPHGPVGRLILRPVPAPGEVGTCQGGKLVAKIQEMVGMLLDEKS